MRHVLLNVQYILTRSRINAGWLLLTYGELLIRAFLANKGGKSSAAAMINTLTGLKITGPDHSTVVNLFEEIFIHDVYFFDSSHHAPAIMDCGSNIGFASLYFKRLYKKSNITAFEPSSENFNYLRANISQNTLNIDIHHAALSDFNGATSLSTNGKSKSSLNFTIIHHHHTGGAETVNVEQLSVYIDQPIDMLKIDTEGSETEIINDLIVAGKIGLINQMIIEYHPDAASEPQEVLVSKLQQSGFSCEVKADTIHPGAREKLLYCVRSALPLA